MSVERSASLSLKHADQFHLQASMAGNMKSSTKDVIRGKLAL